MTGQVGRVTGGTRTLPPIARAAHRALYLEGATHGEILPPPKYIPAGAVPGGKDTARKFLSHYHKTSKTLVYDLQPAAIRVHGNVAIVHYHYTQIARDAAGKDKESSGRWSDILMKQGDKWVLIGDSGGRTSKE